METWQQWREMARESLTAARILETKAVYRSSVSRYYYCAYQAITAVLLYRGLAPPASEEAWGHGSTPDLVVEQLEVFIRRRDDRRRYAEMIRNLYEWRIQADYRGGSKLDTKIEECRKYAYRLVRIMDDILPEG